MRKPKILINRRGGGGGNALSVPGNVIIKSVFMKPFKVFFQNFLATIQMFWLKNPEYKLAVTKLQLQN